MAPRGRIGARIVGGAGMCGLCAVMLLALASEILHVTTATPLLAGAQLMTVATAIWAMAGVVDWRRFQD